MFKTIQIDIDGVLADFVYGFTKIANKFFGSPVKKYNEMKFYNDFNLTENQIKTVWEEINLMDDFWEKLPYIISRSTFLEINSLRFKYNVLFVTNRTVGKISPQHQTTNWLKDRGICSPNVIISTDKTKIIKAVGVNYSIEDMPENANHIAEVEGCLSFLLNAPYNIDIKTDSKVIRVNNVDEFLENIGTK